MSNETIVKGTAVHLVADLTDLTDAPENASGVLWLVTDPAGHETNMSSSVANPDVGVYTLDVVGDTVGTWRWRVVTSGIVVATDGEFTVTDDYAVVGDPTKPVDLRVLVPRARRYCEGPFPDRDRRLTDQQLYEMVADALGDIILLTADDFTRRLIVTARDSRVGYPVAWATDQVLTEWEAAIITTQAALNFFFHEFKDKKVSETITNEGQTWEYALSATVIRQQFDVLKDTRDRALTAMAQITPSLARFASVIAVRDRTTSSILEWWAQANPGQLGPSGGLGGGQEVAVVPVFFPQTG